MNRHRTLNSRNLILLLTAYMCQPTLVLLFLYCLPKLSFLKCHLFLQGVHMSVWDRGQLILHLGKRCPHILNGNYWKHSNAVFLRLWPPTVDIYKLLKPDFVCFLTHIRSRSIGKEQRLEIQIIFLTHVQLLICDVAEGELGQ